jgi:hypothetical protein
VEIKIQTVETRKVKVVNYVPRDFNVTKRLEVVAMVERRIPKTRRVDQPNIDMFQIALVRGPEKDKYSVYARDKRYTLRESVQRELEKKQKVRKSRYGTFNERADSYSYADQDEGDINDLFDALSRLARQSRDDTNSWYGYYTQIPIRPSRRPLKDFKAWGYTSWYPKDLNRSEVGFYKFYYRHAEEGRSDRIIKIAMPEDLLERIKLDIIVNKLDK